MMAIETTPARQALSRRGFLQRSASGFAAAIAITSTGALLNASEAWALDVKGLKPETMKTLILVARDIYPHDKVADRFYAIAMKGYDEKAAGNPEMKAEIEGFVAALDGAAGDGGYVGRPWEADRVAILKNMSADPMFETIRSGLVVSLYNQKEIWPIFGYEGESFSKGGYIDIRSERRQRRRHRRIGRGRRNAWQRTGAKRRQSCRARSGQALGLLGFHQR
jgi:hypothetical protein